MSSLQIYIDANFPQKLVKALKDIHSLQKPVRYQILDGNEIEVLPGASTNTVLLFVNYPKRIEIPIFKHYDEGYKVVVCKAGNVEKPDFFEFAMTVLRVWPRIIEVSEQETEPFLYTFTYNGRKLNKKEM